MHHFFFYLPAPSLPIPLSLPLSLPSAGAEGPPPLSGRRRRGEGAPPIAPADRAEQVATTTSSSPEVAGAASEKWDGRFRLHKPRGKHLLTNPRVHDAIARRAAIGPGDAVLEVGPGAGNLTARLLASPALRVAAVEIDPRMVEAVTARAAALGLADKLTVIAGDAVVVDFPEFDVCVANIPYGISSPLIAKLLFGAYRFRTATLLLQKEFARRLAAAPGDREYNRLAANVRLVADVRLLMDVSKRDFVPIPRVDSSLVEIRPRAVAPVVDLGEWLAFTRACFGQKNKTLGAIFKQKRMVMQLFIRSQRAEDRRSLGVRRARRQEAVEAVQRRAAATAPAVQRARGAVPVHMLFNVFRFAEMNSDIVRIQRLISNIRLQN
ncbi:hypothetical protein C2845_PM01G44600 [Panicum miliaceum]|uniref:rRNA adenine N(6)-methyltransferase n=1 Tax=Panicum miliaceum TaxID=4540 RepID=A0A3L6THL6_PANMI|nr:hypothetical protein C2845_PM01G44600 [Panicum miliaceum]